MSKPSLTASSDREEIRLLGRMLGDVIRETEGKATFDKSKPSDVLPSGSGVKVGHRIANCYLTAFASFSATNPTLSPARSVIFCTWRTLPKIFSIDRVTVKFC